MSRVSSLLSVAILIAACLVTYWAGLGGGFFFDDYYNLIENPDWKISSLSLIELERAMSHGIASDIGRPLAMLSFALNYYFTGMDTWWLKLTGLLIHALNAVLVFLLLKKIFDCLARRYPERSFPGSTAALAIALIWALHPLQVSSVLYIIQRMETAAQCCVLLALLAYVRARDAQLHGLRGWPWLIAAGIATVLGLGFKETAILAPGFALLIEATVFGFRARNGARSRGWIAFYAMGVAAALALFVVVLLPRYLPEAAYSFRSFTLSQRLWTQLPILTMYLGQILLPLPEAMHFYYDNFPISSALFSPPSTAAAATLLLALIALAIGIFKRLPLITLGIGWFFMAHLLTSNVIPLELAYEHRNYLALLGPFIAFAQPLAWLGRRLEADTRAVLTFLPAIAVAGLCFIQVLTWASPTLLATTFAGRSPTSARAQHELGIQLLGNANGDEAAASWSMAKKQFEAAADLPRSSIVSDQALVIMLARVNKPAGDAVWKRMQDKLGSKRMGAEDINSLYGMLSSRISLGAPTDDDENLYRLFQTALDKNPGSAVLHSQFGNYCWNVLGDREMAIRMQRDAVSLAPGDSIYLVGLSKYLLASTAADLKHEGAELLASIKANDRDGRFLTDIAELERIQRELPATTP